MTFEIQRFSSDKRQIKYITKNNIEDDILLYDNKYFNINIVYKENNKNKYVGITALDDYYEVSDIKVKYNDKKYSIVKKNPLKMTVKIDQNNSNSATCCSYADDAINMTPGSSEWDDFFGFYPVILKNGVEQKKLNKNNFNKYLDNTTADITSGNSGDVMIAFPIRGLEISTKNDIVSITMTNDLYSSSYLAHQRGLTKKDKFYIGAYEGSELNSQLRSLSDKTALSARTLGDFRNLAHNTGSGYDVVGFYQYMYLQAMYILKYRNLNSQLMIGNGFTQGNWSNLIGYATTGGTNTKGMTYGSTNHEQMKLFGIEDLFGNYCDWIDGLYIDENYNILTATQNFNDTGMGYTNRGKGTDSNLSGFLTKIQGTTETGFLAKAVQGTDESLSNTYYCDDSRLIANCIANFGGYFADLSVAGIFQIHADTPITYSHQVVGGRLMYL